MQNRSMDEKEEEVSLIMAPVKVIEYLEPLMSTELLCKFPDNSAFDFDYTQSSLWSPLLPRPYSPADWDLITPRKLGFEFGQELEKSMSNGNKSRHNVKKKIVTAALNINLNLLKIKSKKRKKMASDFSPNPLSGCAPAPIFTKMLKAASKHFKRKKKESTVHHMKLPNNYLRDSYI